MKYGSGEEGANWLKTILAIDPNHAETQDLLTEYYERTGEKRVTDLSEFVGQSKAKGQNE